jgi:hypothetical protein
VRFYPCRVSLNIHLSKAFEVDVFGVTYYLMCDLRVKCHCMKLDVDRACNTHDGLRSTFWLAGMMIPMAGQSSAHTIWDFLNSGVVDSIPVRSICVYQHVLCFVLSVCGLSRH